MSQMLPQDWHARLGLCTIMLGQGQLGIVYLIMPKFVKQAAQLGLS